MPWQAAQAAVLAWPAVASPGLSGISAAAAAAGACAAGAGAGFGAEAGICAASEPAPISAENAITSRKLIHLSSNSFKIARPPGLRLPSRTSTTPIKPMRCIGLIAPLTQGGWKRRTLLGVSTVELSQPLQGRSNRINDVEQPFPRRALRDERARSASAAAGHGCRSRLRRALECGQIQRPECDLRSVGSGAYLENARAHSVAECLRPRRGAAPDRSARLRLRESPRGSAGKMATGDRRLPARARIPARYRVDHGLAPSAQGFRSADAGVLR